MVAAGRSRPPEQGQVIRPEERRAGAEVVLTGRLEPGQALFDGTEADLAITLVDLRAREEHL